MSTTTAGSRGGVVAELRDPNWLTAHDIRVQVDALDEAADDLWDSGYSEGVLWVVGWLRRRAERLHRDMRERATVDELRGRGSDG